MTVNADGMGESGDRLQCEYKPSHRKGGTAGMTDHESVTAMPQNVSKNSN